MTSAATSIASWSRRRGPTEIPGRQIASRIAANWTFALSLPQIEGLSTVPSAAVTAPRRPRINSSRPTITNASHADARPVATSEIKTPDTRSLSAVVSRKLPSVVAFFQRRARRPSRKSVIAADANRIAAVGMAQSR